MPPLPKLNNPALVALEERLRVLPKAQLIADIDRAEGLTELIEDDASYPEPWVIERITGDPAAAVQPAGGAQTRVGGVELKAELSSLVERLCDLGRLTLADFNGTELVEADTLCERWNMSRQTLSRLRRRGLVARRILSESGKPRLMFALATVERFERDHPGAIRRAAEYSRMSPELQQRMIRRASRYKRLLGLSLNAAAARIASRFGRSHEAVRQLLKRYELRAAKGTRASADHADPSGESPIFNQAQPLTDSRREAVFRAWRLGIDSSLVCEKFRRSRAAVRRAVNVARATRLFQLAEQGLLSHHAPPPAGALSSAREKLLLKPGAGRKKQTPSAIDAAALMPLDSPPVCTGLGEPALRSINEILAEARSQQPPIAFEERLRLIAYNHLRAQAAARIAELDRLFPHSTALDQIETYLRWAARLKAALTRTQFRLIVDTLESRMERRLEELPRSAVPKVLHESILAAAEAVDQIDPARAGRLAGPVGIAADRIAGRWRRELSPPFNQAHRRAIPILPNTPDMPDWGRTLCPWQRWLEPHPRTRDAVEQGLLDPRAAEFLRHRFGWSGGPPRTLLELGADFGLTPIRVVVFEQRALRDARAAFAPPAPARAPAQPHAASPA
ncbi:MAG: hypothetical protein KF859_13290 [Phycisphaeraceae bacterium]|nr:hypothetical protein [Phycisphaeraceae bacterium]